MARRYVRALDSPRRHLDLDVDSNCYGILDEVRKTIRCILCGKHWGIG